MLDESTVSPAVASLIQGASDDTKNSVVQFVRAAKVVSVLFVWFNTNLFVSFINVENIFDFRLISIVKQCFSEDKPVLKTDMVIADGDQISVAWQQFFFQNFKISKKKILAVRRVALNVKTLLTYLQDKLVGHEVVAPVVAPTNEIVEVIF